MVHAEIHINLPILLCAASRKVIVEALLIILPEKEQILIDTETFPWPPSVIRLVPVQLNP